VSLGVRFTVEKYKALHAFDGKFQPFNQKIRTLLNLGRFLRIVKDNLIHPDLVNYVVLHIFL
jgi:hypothetical protein